MSVVIGIDPDSNKNGIAIYRNGVLIELLNLNSIQFYKWIVENEKQSLKNNTIIIHMENPKGNNSSAFNHNKSLTQGAKNKISERVGMVKQAQTSIEQVAGELGIQVVLHRVSSQWKKGRNKVLFEKVTNWKGRSNEDTRSAAWFGYLGIK